MKISGYFNNTATRGVIISLTVCILILLALFVLFSKVKAAQQEVSLEIFPSTIQLDQHKPVEVLLILRNPTPNRLQDIKVSWFSSADFKVDIDSPAVLEIQPAGLLSLRATITQTSVRSAPRNIYFQVSYFEVTDDQSQNLHRVSLGTLEVQEPSIEKVDQVAEVRIETTLDQIEEQRPGPVYLVVRNLTNMPIIIENIRINKPTFIITSIPDLSEGIILAPQASHIFTIPVSVSDTAQTGQQRILFEVDVAWQENGHNSSGSLLVAHTVNVGIIGESDLLQLLGVPSLLFLPGFLMMTTVLTLWNRVFPRTKPGPEFTPPEFALISITLSLLTAIMYPAITAQFYGAPRDYLQAYGLRDVFRVWFGSVAVGLMIWALVSGGSSLLKRLMLFWEARQLKKVQLERMKEIANRTPLETDTPRETLEKMAINLVQFPLNEVKIELLGHTFLSFIILQDPQDNSFFWISPSILLKPKDKINLGDNQYQNKRQEYLDKIETARNRNAKELASVLDEASEFWEIAWNKEGSFTGPKRVHGDELKNVRKSLRSFVEVE